jgi:hypothetical protein
MLPFGEIEFQCSEAAVRIRRRGRYASINVLTAVAGRTPANSCRSEAQTGFSMAAGRNPTPNFVGLGQVRSVAPSLQIS